MHPLFNCCHSEHSPLCKKRKKKEPPEKSWILENAPKNKLCTRDAMEAFYLSRSKMMKEFKMRVYHGVCQEYIAAGWHG
jgi:hypothetical protein